MNRNISPSAYYHLPSGAAVHPWRLIQKDGSLMWKHALLYQNEHLYIPETQAQEQHIIKTAQRIEELNSWVSQDLDPWEFLKPVLWYSPDNEATKEGISLYFKHTCLPSVDVYNTLQRHINEFETLKLYDDTLYFSRC